jgi:hypothetical protein
VSEIVLPAVALMASLTFTYLFCIRPMRRGSSVHGGAAHIPHDADLSAEDVAELARLRQEVAALRG